jgi:hypothetical protein
MREQWGFPPDTVARTQLSFSRTRAFILWITFQNLLSPSLQAEEKSISLYYSPGKYARSAFPFLVKGGFPPRNGIALADLSVDRKSAICP